MRVAMRWPLLCLLALLLVPALAGCGGSGAGGAVADAQKHLADVTRATVHVKLALDTLPRATGFQLDGAFSTAPGEGPLADAVYRRPRRPVHILLDRTHGTIRTGSAPAVALGPALLAVLDDAVGPRTLRGIAGYIQARDWVTEPVLRREGDLDHVTGGLDVARAARDLLEIAAFSGHAAPELTEDDLARVNSLVASSSFDLTETHDDHVLRHLAIRFALKPEARTQRLGKLLGSHGALVVGLDHVGEPVRVPPS
jgi:hypothetical protein